MTFATLHYSGNYTINEKALLIKGRFGWIVNILFSSSLLPLSHNTMYKKALLIKGGFGWIVYILFSSSNLLLLLNAVSRIANNHLLCNAKCYVAVYLDKK